MPTILHKTQAEHSGNIVGYLYRPTLHTNNGVNYIYHVIT